jgi:hypothetical protein
MWLAMPATSVCTTHSEIAFAKAKPVAGFSRNWKKQHVNVWYYKYKLFEDIMKVFTTIPVAILFATSAAFAGGKCTGKNPCSACTSCSGCKYCAKEGGECGTCAKPKPKKTKAEPKTGLPPKGDTAKINPQDK